MGVLLLSASVAGDGSHLLTMIVFMVGYAVLLWPMLAMCIKRLPDRGLSGSWLLVIFVPLIGGLWFLVICGFLRGEGIRNRFGAPPMI